MVDARALTAITPDNGRVMKTILRSRSAAHAVSNLSSRFSRGLETPSCPTCSSCVCWTFSIARLPVIQLLCRNLFCRHPRACAIEDHATHDVEPEMPTLFAISAHISVVALSKLSLGCTQEPIADVSMSTARAPFSSSQRHELVRPCCRGRVDTNAQGSCVHSTRRSRK